MLVEAELAARKLAAGPNPFAREIHGQWLEPEQTENHGGGN